MKRKLFWAMVSLSVVFVGFLLVWAFNFLLDVFFGFLAGVLGFWPSVGLFFVFIWAVVGLYLYPDKGLKPENLSD